MNHQDDLTEEIIQALKNEPYGMKARQIVEKIAQRNPFPRREESLFSNTVDRPRSQEVVRKCEKEPLIVAIDGFVKRYRLMTMEECEKLGERLKCIHTRANVFDNKIP